MLICKGASDHAPPRMADQDDGLPDGRLAKEPVQLSRRGFQTARRRSKVTPGLGRSVISACPDALRQLHLNQSPVERIIAKPMQQDDRRLSVANTQDMNSISTDIDQF